MFSSHRPFHHVGIHLRITQLSRLVHRRDGEIADGQRIDEADLLLCDEGFVALAPDLLSSEGGTPADEDKAREMISKLDPAQPIADDVAAVAYLKTIGGGNGKVGAIGFCWGGGQVNMLAVNAPDLDAGVAYYGAQPKDEAAIAKIHAPLLLHYAGLDERINAGIDAYKKALDANHKQYTVYVYDGVNHAFNNDTSAARYDKAAADLAWQRTVAFLKKNLA